MLTHDDVSLLKYIVNALIILRARLIVTASLVEFKYEVMLMYDLYSFEYSIPENPSMGNVKVSYKR